MTTLHAATRGKEECLVRREKGTQRDGPELERSISIKDLRGRTYGTIDENELT